MITMIDQLPDRIDDMDKEELVVEHLGLDRRRYGRI